MADKILKTRISLKYGAIGEWSSTFKPLKGEVCFSEVSTEKKDAAGNIISVPAVVFKVGDGVKTFGELPWTSALAADVYDWAKMSQEEFETYLTTFIGEKVEDTNDNTTYAFEIPAEGENKGKLVITETPHVLGVAGTPVVTSYDFVTPDELTTILEDYYTTNEIDTMVNGKLHTEAEIKTIAATEINRLIGAADDEGGETIQSIANLVDYVEKNAGEIAGLVTDVIEANTNASNAVSTANTANTTANSALTKAESALEGAAGAVASAAAAAQSATDAAGSAATATEKASDATQSATDAANAKSAAETAKTDAVCAKAAAVTSQGKAEDAQGAAETAQAKAEAAQEAAEASNTSATAIANAAKTASETATSAVNDIKANYIRVGADNKMYLGMEGTDVIIFDCGGAE